MHSDLTMLAGVSMTVGLASMSPGPAFLMVSRVAASQSRRLALATGFGVATAASAWAVCATFGAALLLARLPALYAAVQLAGAVYLIALGLSAWRDSHAIEAPVDGPHGRGLAAAYRRGLWLSLGNPKIILFYGSIFVSLIQPGSPRWLRVAALGIVFAQEFAWYVLVATLFSHATVQALYGRARGQIERVMGAVFIAIGARIAAAARI